MPAVATAPNAMELRRLDIPESAMTKPSSALPLSERWGIGIGDRVAIHSGYRYRRCTAGAAGALFPEMAVMFNPLGAGFAWGVAATELQPGQTLAVLGSEQRGICCAIAAKESGAAMVAITGLGRDEHKLALARDPGADRAVHIAGADPVERILAATAGAGVDCIVDTTPYFVASVNQAVQMAKPSKHWLP